MTSAAPPAPGNLPAEPNSFIGRERDLSELALLVSDVRALTLCGPGGIGKTRLALRLACDLVPEFPDGAWLVELADTADAELIPRRVAATFGIREEQDRPPLGPAEGAPPGAYGGYQGDPGDPLADGDHAHRADHRERQDPGRRPELIGQCAAEHHRRTGPLGGALYRTGRGGQVRSDQVRVVSRRAA